MTTEQEFAIIKMAQSLIADYDGQIHRALVRIRKEGGIVLLNKGRMRPAACIIVDVSCHNRVKIRRLGQNKEYWVGIEHIEPILKA